MNQPKKPVNQPDAGKRREHSSKSVDQKVAAQETAGAKSSVFHSSQGKRNQGEYDQRVENHGREDCTLRRVQSHDVELSERWVGKGKHGGKDCKVFRHVI